MFIRIPNQKKEEVSFSRHPAVIDIEVAYDTRDIHRLHVSVGLRRLNTNEGHAELELIAAAKGLQPVKDRSGSRYKQMPIARNRIVVSHPCDVVANGSRSLCISTALN